MITSDIITQLYKRYSKRPKSVDMLNVADLFECAGEHHQLHVDPETEMLTIGSIEARSPFHEVPLSHIHGIVPFEEWVSVVLPSSIIFLNRKNTKASIHIKPMRPSLLDRIRGRVL